MPLTPDEANERIAAARRRPAPTDTAPTAPELAELRRAVLLREAAEANSAALPQPKDPSNPS